MPALNTGTRQRHRRRSRLLLGSVIVVAVLIVLGLLNTGTLQDRLVAPAQVATNPSPTARLSDQEQAYFEYVRPRLQTVDAESRRLADLGRTKSRNLFEIETRGRRVNNASDEIDAYVKDHGVPPRFAGSYESYQQGIENVRTAMKTARDALFSFNFDQVPAAVAQFDAGTRALDEALLQLQQESGKETSAPAATATGG